VPPASNQRIEVHAAFRFAIQIDGITEAVFTECTLPALEVEVHQQMEGGLNNAVHQIPGRVKAGKITLKRGVTTSSELVKWYVDIAKGTITPNQRKVSVVMYDSESTEVLRWNFENAFPSKWSGPSFSSGKNEVAVETLELAYQSVDIE
jgi:phage tail-like protein